MTEFREGDRLVYRNSECEIIEVGATYICVKDLYTGVKYLLPIKTIDWVSLDPAEIRSSSSESRR